MLCDDKKKQGNKKSGKGGWIKFEKGGVRNIRVRDPLPTMIVSLTLKKCSSFVTLVSVFLLFN